MKKNKVLVIGTGGIIGAKIANKRFKYGELTQEKILSLIPNLKKEVDIYSTNIFRMDSADMQPHHWLTLAKTIYYNLGKYKGIVVTIGTDTMVYAAAAISFLIQKQGVPIVFTGSQINANRLNSDAILNLKNAILIAGEADLAETVITFNRRIIRGVRAKRISASDYDAFTSFGGEGDLGLIEYKPIIYSHHRKRNVKEKPIISTSLEEKVVIVKAYPGFDYNTIRRIVDSGVRGIVLEGLGLGLLPHDREGLFKKNLEYAREKKVPIVLTSHCSLGKNWREIYEAEKKNRVEDKLTISAYDMTTEAAYVKLMWVLAQTNKMGLVKKMMQKNYVGEVSKV